MTFKTTKGTQLQILNLKGKDYLPVAQRIVWFREIHPEGTILTEPVKLDEGIAVFKATISNQDGHALAMAHKSETPKGFADYIEKAETGAIGRALALCGFGTQFTADELDEGERLADAPIQKIQNFAVEPKAKIGKYLFPSEAQIKRLYAIAKAHGWTQAQVISELTDAGFKSISELPSSRYEAFCKMLEMGAPTPKQTSLTDPTDDIPF